MNDNFKLRILFIIISILILFAFTSCKSKKIIIETHSTDTIYKSEIIKITPSQINSLIIDSPCDSLGNLKPFNYSFGTDGDSVSLKSVNNNISLETKKDSIIQKETSEKQVSVKISNKEEITYKTPLWIWKLIVIMSIIIIIETLIIFKR